MALYDLRIQGMKPALEDCVFLANEVELYSQEQMREVYNGYMGYLTEEQLKVFCSHKLNSLQMHEIRMGFVAGLPMRSVLLYADRSVPWQLMKALRKRLVACMDAGTDFYFTEQEQAVLAERGIEISLPGSAALRHEPGDGEVD